MHHRTVAELMTRDVVRARRDTPFKEIVRLLTENDVTAVPVVDDRDHPIGVVSEADLLRKSADQSDPSGRAPVAHLEARERAKAEGARAEELMSEPAVCARPDWNVVAAARLMETHHVKRLPVVAHASAVPNSGYPAMGKVACMSRSMRVRRSSISRKGSHMGPLLRRTGWVMAGPPCLPVTGLTWAIR